MMPSLAHPRCTSTPVMVILYVRLTGRPGQARSKELNRFFPASPCDQRWIYRIRNMSLKYATRKRPEARSSACQASFS